MRSPFIADFWLLFVALVWGSTFVLVQNAISTLPPFTFNALRFAIAAMFLMFWLLAFNRDQFKQFTKRTLLSGVMLGFWLFIGYAFQTFGLLYTTSSKAGFITGLNVVLVPLLIFFLLKQRPRLNSIAGVILAAAGLYLLTTSGVSKLNFGDGLILVCAFGFALHIYLTDRFSSKYPTLLLTSIQIMTVSILSSICSSLFEDPRHVLSTDIFLSTNVVVALLITSMLATALAFFIQTNFQKHTTPTRVALIFAMEPVFAAITAFYYGGERFSSNMLVGCAFIFCGMVISELPENITFAGKKRGANSNV